MAFLYRLRHALRRRLPFRGPRPRFRRRNGFSIAVPFDHSPAIAPGRYAVVLHLFYPAMAAEFLEKCSKIPGVVDIYVSTDTADKQSAIWQEFVGWDRGKVVIRLTPNRGRDMTAKFVTFRSDLADYDLILFLHSKRSLHLAGGADWRNVLTKALVDDRSTVESIIALFQADPLLGVVFPQHYDGIRDYLTWGDNRRHATRIADELGLPLHRARSFDFVSGSMFWARPQALEPLWSLSLTVADFEDEAGQLDGTLAHALERMILFAAEHGGFSWLKVAHRPFYAKQKNILVVRSAQDLSRSMARARFRLLRG